MNMLGLLKMDVKMFFLLNCSLNLVKIFTSRTFVWNTGMFSISNYWVQ